MTNNKSKGLTITDKILESIKELLAAYSSYISGYVDYLNTLILVQRRVSSLRFERMTLIKYVKKLRFMNDVLHSWSFESSSELLGKPLNLFIDDLGQYLVKVFEILDLLNFYITQSLRGETVSKTLNENLAVSEPTIACINDSYRIYIKGIQWLVESIQDCTEKRTHLGLELIEFTKRCAEEDEVNPEDSDDILLQDVAMVTSEDEYGHLLHDWTAVLLQKQEELRERFLEDSKVWTALAKPGKKQ